MPLTRPMLAGRLKSLRDLRYPLLLTPKFDGIRCLKVGGRALSRAFKPIRNEHIGELIESKLPDGVDGELVVPGDFSAAQSSVMSAAGRPDFEYCIFDAYNPSAPYCDRVKELADALPKLSWLKLVLPVQVSSEEDFLQFEDACLSKGYEGVIARSADGPYKCGRSTVREGYMVKWKRMHDSEAVILGFAEARENCNPQVPNAFGLMKRPGGSALKSPKGTLGSILCRDSRTGVEFEIGTGIGLTQTLRQQLWDDQQSYVGRTVSYRCQTVGMKDKPRFPSFLGFREDM